MTLLPTSAYTSAWTSRQETFQIGSSRNRSQRSRAKQQNYAPTVPGRHHLLPRAVGNYLPSGHNALTLLSGEKHAILQGELNVHLRSITKTFSGGKVVDMMPRRGNAG